MSLLPSRETVRFTRDGRRLLLRDDDRLSLVELPGGAEQVLGGDGPDGAFAALRGFVGFEDEVWVVDGVDAPRLLRFDLQGRRIGDGLTLAPGGDGARLLAAPFGGAAALWTGESPCELRYDEGRLVVEPLEPGADLMVPVAPRRRIERRMGLLRRRGPDGEQLLGAAGIIEGDVLLEAAAVLEERALAIVLQRGAACSLLVVSLQSGVVQHRLPLGPVEAVRFAPMRGHVMVQLDARKLRVIDLRFGRALRTWDEPAEVADFAVDQQGKNLVLRRSREGGGTEVFFGSYRDVIGQAVLAPGGATRIEITDEPRGEAQAADDDTEVADGEPEAPGLAGSPSDPSSDGGPGESTAAMPVDGGATDAGAEQADERSTAAGGDEQAEPSPAPSRPGRGLGSRLPGPRRPLPGKAPPWARRTAALDADADEPGSTEPDLAATEEPSAPVEEMEDAPAPRAASPRPPLPSRRPPTPAPPPGRSGLLRPPPRNEGGVLGSTLLDLSTASPPASPSPRRPMAQARPRGAPSLPVRGTLRSPRAAIHDEPRPDHDGAAPAPPPDPERSAARLEPDEAPAAVIRWLSALCDRAEAAMAEADGEPLSSPATAVEQARATLRRARESSATGIRGLVRQFGLDECAEELLLVSAGPWLDPSLAMRFQRLGGAPCGEATVPLAARLLPERAASSWLAALDAQAPLRRHGLLEAPDGPLAPLRVHPLVVARLRDGEAAAPREHGALVVRVAAPALDELLLPDGLVESLLPRFAGSPRLLVRGRTGSGRRSLVAALAAAHGRVAGFVEAVPPEVPPDEAPEALAVAVREAALRGLLPCVVGLDQLTGAVRARAVARLLALPGPLVLVARPWSESPPGLHIVELPPLHAVDRGRFAARVLGAHHLPAEAAEELALRLPAPPGVVWRAAEAASSREWPEQPDGDAAAAVARAHRRLRAERLAREPGTTQPTPDPWRPALLSPITEDGMAELRVLATASLRADEALAGHAVVALLEGEQGSGRRTAAEILAGQLGCDLHHVDAELLGEDGERAAVTLGRLLEMAEEGALLLHLTAADRMLATPCPALLRCLRATRAVLLLSVSPACPVSASMAEAIAARVPFPLPDLSTRESLWRLLLPREVGDVDVAALARFELHGGAIRAAIDRGGRLASADGQPPTTRHYLRAAALA